MNPKGTDPYIEENPSEGSGLFARCVFCAFILLAIFSLFALHTDFSDRAKVVFKAAVTENSAEFLPESIKTAGEKLFGKGKTAPAEDSQNYLPDSENAYPAETYPNPILMPSETAQRSGFIPSSDI